MLFQNEKKKITKINNIKKNNDISTINKFILDFFQYKYLKFDLCKLNEDLFDDLDIFNSNNGIFKNYDFSTTLFGSNYLKILLQNPTHNIKELEYRKNTIYWFIKNPKALKNIEMNIKKLKDVENDIYWLWNFKEHEKIINDLLYYNYYYLPSFNNLLNNNNLIMNISSTYSIYLKSISFITGPILTVLIPIIISKYFFKRNLPIIPMLKFTISNMLSPPIYLNSNMYIVTLLLRCIWYALYVNSIYSNLYLCITKYSLIKFISKKILKINEIVKCTNLCLNYLDNNTKNYFIRGQKLNKLNIKHKNIKFYNIGDLLTDLIFVNNNKYSLVSYINIIGAIDGTISIVKCLLNNYWIKNNICLPIYEKDKCIKLCDDIWHPLLNNCQTNKFILDNKVCIITGPNASGKSTFTKSIIIDILFSQSWCISFTKNSITSSFKYISTYMRIKDNVGSESLFQKELKRCNEIIQSNSLKKPNENSISIIDEIFSSTNINSGEKGAIKFINKIIETESNFTLLTTHYSNLNNLNNKNIKYYKFKCIEKDSKIKYDYTIYKGYSKDNIGYKMIDQMF